jgi:UDP-N-acetylglucosamine diphosphorylase/glucosamine-1-phosphate N-acetyltransferase
MRLCIFEDAGVADLEPLTLTRPAFDLLCGAGTLLEKQRRAFPGLEAGALVRPALAALCRVTHPDLAVNDPAWQRGRRLLLVNARWLPPPAPEVPDGVAVGLAGDGVAWACVHGDEVADGWPWRLAEWKDRLPQRPAGGHLVERPWDLLTHNAAALEQDAWHWAARRPDTTARPGPTVLGPAGRLLIDPAATVEPHAVLDTRGGPVLIDRGALVQAFSRVEGPAYVGPDSQLLAARLRTGSVGPQCRVGGEVESAVLTGFVNKYHDGFLGHSVLGEWVNVGAGTQFSDLRNDYGPIKVYLNGRWADTGMMKVGAFLGDFTRTGISTLLNAGTMAGPFGQLMPSGGYLPRVAPAFVTVSNGRLQERTDWGEMFRTASAAMGRRGQAWTDTHAELYLDLYEQTAEQRRRLIREAEQRRVRRVV